MTKQVIALAAAVALAAGVAGAAPARKAAGTEIAPYGRDLISVATPGRHGVPAATANCLVWANAEGLGVGPAQLGGLHGLTMNINLTPLPGEGPTSFDAGLAQLKTTYPNAPAWLVATLQKNRATIEARCAEDHPEPLKIYTIRAADRG